MELVDNLVKELNVYGGEIGERLIVIGSMIKKVLDGKDKDEIKDIQKLIKEHPNLKISWQHCWRAWKTVCEYPELENKVETKLSISHYGLLAITNLEQGVKDQVQKLAEEENWSCSKLSQEIKLAKGELKVKDKQPERKEFLIKEINKVLPDLETIQLESVFTFVKDLKNDKE